jgi:hypothetical protein
MAYTFSISSNLTVNAEALWDAVVCPTDINAEFRPLLMMTFPRGMDDVTAGWQQGVRRFRSWILLGGLIPVEYDDLCFDAVEPGRFFLERSSMWSQARWEHRRELTPRRGGTRLTDTVAFEPRLPVLAPVHLALFRWIFRWRHRRLRRIYGQTGQRHEL